MMKADGLEQFYLENEGIVIGALKKAKVHPSWKMTWEDWKQVARVGFAEGYLKFPQQVLTLEDDRRLRNYVFQSVLWRVYAMMRELNKEESIASSQILEADNHVGELSTSYDFDDGLFQQDVVKQLLPVLSEFERIYLYETMEEGLTNIAIARKYNVCRKTVYRTRLRIIQKYEKILGKKKK